MQTQTFNIALPSSLVARMDLVATNEYRNRSELIREAVRIYLEDKLEWDDIFEFGRKAAKKAGIKSEDDVNRIVQEYRHGKKGQ
ncbi:ribbon-helix-helix protein, CopG family [Candidatus Collierbacteria bacterium]|nr:ribbon-helix-helix protein, CopG family [Candidatus Collierbacteria bacterium]